MIRGGHIPDFALWLPLAVWILSGLAAAFRVAAPLRRRHMTGVESSPTALASGMPPVKLAFSDDCNGNVLAVFDSGGQRVSTGE